jgi:hypothetical protein
VRIDELKSTISVNRTHFRILEKIKKQKVNKDPKERPNGPTVFEERQKAVMGPERRDKFKERERRRDRKGGENLGERKHLGRVVDSKCDFHAAISNSGCPVLLVPDRHRVRQNSRLIELARLALCRR